MSIATELRAMVDDKRVQDLVMVSVSVVAGAHRPGGAWTTRSMLKIILLRCEAGLIYPSDLFFRTSGLFPPGAVVS
jgi:hypothetical protein